MIVKKDVLSRKKKQSQRLDDLKEKPGYQYGQHHAFTSSKYNINGYYGVSITQGLPRQHVWTYAARNTKNNHHCSCSNGSSVLKLQHL